MLKESFFLSIRNLRRRKLRSWLTILGIFIGIAAIVSLISLGAGLKEAITAQFSTLSTDKLIIQNSGTGFGPPGSTSVRKLTSQDLEIIQGVNGIDEAASRLIRIGKVGFNDAISFTYLGSMPEAQSEIDLIDESTNTPAEQGRLLRQGDKGKVVIGQDAADSSNYGKAIKVGSKISIQGQDFEVIGILKHSSSFQVNLVVFMMEEDMKKILNIGDETDMIIAQIKKGENPEQVAEQISRALRNDRNEKEGEEDFSVQTPLQAISSVNAILSTINAVIIGIAAISLLVGGIGIANTMYTSVIERTKEIGTMKAIGAKNSDILSIFIIESGLLGLIGGIIGVLLGLGLAYAVSSGANAAFGQTILKFNIDLTLIFLAIAFSFIIGILSGLFPAYQASKLKPADALRG